jgi:ribose transport system substrate-binding protein
MQAWKPRVLVFAATVALGLAGCGGDDGDENASSSGQSTTAASSTEKKSPGARTLGVIPSTSASEYLATKTRQFQELVAPLGWKVTVCDPAGAPPKMEQCMQQYVTQKVDAILTMALGGEETPRGLAAAKDAKIPVISIVGDPSPGQEKSFDGVFADSTFGMGEVAGKYIVEQRKDTPVVGLRLTQNYAGDGFIQGVEKVLKENDLKFQDLRDNDLADLINSLTENSQAIAQKNKGPLTFVEPTDFGAGIFGPVFQRAGRKDITIITRYDNASTVKLMKAGEPILVTASRAYQHFFEAADALLALWVDGKPLPPPSIFEPDAGVFAIEDFPEGSDEVFPYEPALDKQMAKWAETYELKEG